MEQSLAPVTKLIILSLKEECQKIFHLWYEDDQFLGPALALLKSRLWLRGKRRFNEVLLQKLIVNSVRLKEEWKKLKSMFLISLSSQLKNGFPPISFGHEDLWIRSRIKTSAPAKKF